MDRELLASVLKDSRFPTLVAEGVGGTRYNVVLFEDKYYALHQADGAFDPAKIQSGGYARRVYVGRSLAEVSALTRGKPFDVAQDRMMLLDRQEKLTGIVRSLCRFMPPGHYYSPIVADEDIEARAAKQPASLARHVPGVDLREEHQRENLQAMAREYNELPPFPADPTPGYRYYHVNDEHWYFDAMSLRHFLLTARPRRVIEIGAGYSSALMLDVDEQQAMNIRFTFIDPDLVRFSRLATPADKAKHEIIQQKVQTVPLNLFDELDAGDILYIDSSHVSKMDSDVNWYMFEILPRLRSGVFVHIHDIDFPFDYPLWMFQQGRSWNESYLLRSFLMYNSAFQIEFFTAFMSNFEIDFIRANMPMCEQRPGGAFWMRKTG
jgi:Methyltransferase domain